MVRTKTRVRSRFKHVGDAYWVTVRARTAIREIRIGLGVRVRIRGLSHWLQAYFTEVGVAQFTSYATPQAVNRRLDSTLNFSGSSG